MEAALLLLLCWGLASASAQEDEDMMEVMVLPSLGPGNVMVDQSPLQPQLQKNKECKLNVIDATLTFGPVSILTRSIKFSLYYSNCHWSN